MCGAALDGTSFPPWCRPVPLPVCLTVGWAPLACRTAVHVARLCRSCCCAFVSSVRPVVRWHWVDVRHSSSLGKWSSHELIHRVLLRKNASELSGARPHFDGAGPSCTGAWTFLELDTRCWLPTHCSTGVVFRFCQSRLYELAFGATLTRRRFCLSRGLHFTGVHFFDAPPT